MEQINHNNLEKFYSKKIEIDTQLVIGEINDLTLVDNIVKEIKTKLPLSTLTGKTSVKGLQTDFNALNDNVDFFNFLKMIEPSFKKICDKNFRIADVWGNIYNNQEHYCLPHSHFGDKGFCGILYCTDKPGPGTYFRQYDLTVEEKKGRYVLFTPIVTHEVKKFNYNKERITLAFNCKEIMPWENLTDYIMINDI